MKNKKIFIIIIVCILMATLIGVAVAKKPQTESNIGGAKGGTRVKVERVTTGDIMTKISSSGKLAAVHSESIYLESNNTVVKLHKEVGDYVEKGEIILELDQDIKSKSEKNIEALEAQLAAAKETLNSLYNKGSEREILLAKTSLEQAKNTKQDTLVKIENGKIDVQNKLDDLEKAREDLIVQEELFKEGLTSEKEKDAVKDQIKTLEQSIAQAKDAITLMENSIATIDLQIQSETYNLDLLQNKVSDPNKKQSIATAESQIKNIEAQIYSSQMDLEKTTTEVIAPISGVITVVPQEEGMMVAPGTPLVTIVDPSQLKVACEISPYYAADLKVGLKAEIKYTGSTTIEVVGELAKVAAIATVKQSANGETTVIPVEVQVTEPGKVLRPGFAVDVKIVTETRENVCVVPILATVQDEDLVYVYVINEEDGTLEKREVTEGLSNGLNIEISGVEEGELIVSNPTDYLKNVTKVSYEKIGDVQ